VAKLKID